MNPALPSHLASPFRETDYTVLTRAQIDPRIVRIGACHCSRAPAKRAEDGNHRQARTLRLAQYLLL